MEGMTAKSVAGGNRTLISTDRCVRYCRLLPQRGVLAAILQPPCAWRKLDRRPFARVLGVGDQVRHIQMLDSRQLDVSQALKLQEAATGRRTGSQEFGLSVAYELPSLEIVSVTSSISRDDGRTKGQSTDATSSTGLPMLTPVILGPPHRSRPRASSARTPRRTPSHAVLTSLSVWPFAMCACHKRRPSAIAQPSTAASASWRCSSSCQRSCPASPTWRACTASWRSRS